ncbi:hypothetical protein QWJ34_25725 [Saccharibacillus sp. CPCC 101409]|uniref:hypothetical protein n=1 Tax=Saccharibacillus sp. CPCC 101409 TaxID=3058041 RepID=UPI002673B8D2|nr:hypothetical protein [Saccharibacillus sp. CPCC 101409]MDO3413177.1 hypothetical protein [Saccharibacillus sp. CPCC 101409]
MSQWYLLDQQRNGHPAQIETLLLPEAKLLHQIGWERNFNWADVITDIRKGPPQKLIAINDNRIHGAISYRIDEGFVFIDLLESSPLNRRFITPNREFTNVADILIGQACLISANSGFGGYVAFDAKTDLVSYYRKRFGAKSIGSQRMFINEDSALDLIALYYK